MSDRLWLAPLAATAVSVVVGSPPWVVAVCGALAVTSLAAVVAGRLRRRPHSHAGRPS